MDNMELYNKWCEVPNNAQKTIEGGPMKGKTDINPMWRIKHLTEQFGPCGIGWKYEITGREMKDGSEGQIATFVDINLYIKHNGEWSEPIPGTGGNMFISKNKHGLYTSDECYKMALTDAISVACKALGMGADVYWGSDPTKYTRVEPAADTDVSAVDDLVEQLKEQDKDVAALKKAAHTSAVNAGHKVKSAGYYQHVAGELAKGLG